MILSGVDTHKLDKKNEFNMTMKKELKHLLGAIDDSPVLTDPYKHAHIDGLFSEEFYKKLIDSLPEDDAYYRYKHGSISSYGEDSPRLRIDLIEPFLSSLPDGHPIKDFANICVSQELKNKIFEKFNIINKKEYWPQSSLLRDKKGYRIKPHPDGFKVATFLIYLPEDNDHEDIGTIINVKTGKKFKEHSRTKYRMNTGFMFAVRGKKESAPSWHSVNTLGYDDYDRNLTTCIYYRSRELAADAVGNIATGRNKHK